MHIVIIGNGISGISCARHIRKESDHLITVISSESEHFYSRTALMYIYMGHMRYQDTKPYEDWFWEKNRIELVYDRVTAIQPENKSIQLKKGPVMNYDKLVIATGSSSNKFGWPGQDLPGVQGLYNLQDLELMEANTRGTQRAVIVGGGLIGIEMAEMLRSREIPVTMLVRESSFWNMVLPPGESELINRHIREHHIDLRLDAELKEILPGDDGRTSAVVTKDGEKIDCQFVGLTVGVHPNIGFLKGSGIETGKGVLVNEYLETNITDIYAAGDCAEFQTPLPDRRPVEQVWYTGKMQGVTLAQTICGKRTAYQPGIWFNSAKFFDIEYQTYGVVPATLPETHQDFYWEHPEGKLCVHLTYEKSTGKFTGINTLGIRYRHALMHQFIQEGRTIKYVIENLPAANFDPEFYSAYEYFIRAAYNLRFPEDKIQTESKRGLRSFFQLTQNARA
jgi:NAD(P)H-nitrite reductase large subunit